MLKANAYLVGRFSQCILACKTLEIYPRVPIRATRSRARYSSSFTSKDRYHGGRIFVLPIAIGNRWVKGGPAISITKTLDRARPVDDPKPVTFGPSTETVRNSRARLRGRSARLARPRATREVDGRGSRARNVGTGPFRYVAEECVAIVGAAIVAF